jgi:tetratricopeptide (TPR) repeat protein
VTTRKKSRTRDFFYHVSMAETTRIEMLKEILSQTPADPLARYALGMEYSGAGDVEAAVGEFRTLLEHKPDYANAYFMAAQTLAKADRKDEAKKWLHDGIAAAQRAGNRHAQSEMQGMLEELELGY